MAGYVEFEYASTIDGTQQEFMDVSTTAKYLASLELSNGAYINKAHLTHLKFMLKMAGLTLFADFSRQSNGKVLVGLRDQPVALLYNVKWIDPEALANLNTPA